MITDGNAALKLDYVANIPWEKCPAFTFTHDTQRYLDAFREVVDFVPTTNLQIKFEDDIWDFNPYFSHLNSNSYKFIFYDTPEEIKMYCKFFILYKIIGKSKISTTNVRYSSFLSIIRNIMKRTNHRSIFVITTQDIVDEIKRRHASSSTIHNLYQSAFQVYSFLIKNYKLDLPVDLSVLDQKSLVAKKKDKAQNNKLPDIPDKYFNAILNKAVQVMKDSTAQYDYRMTAAALVFISQTGLRLGDFLSLTTDRLFSKKLPKSGNVANYVHFTEMKPSKPHQPLLEFDIFCNTLATDAYNIMKKLRTQSVFSHDNNFLFVLSDVNAKSKYTLPHPRYLFNNNYHRFMYHYLYNEATREWEGIKPYVYHNSIAAEKKGLEQPTILYAPDTRQYRVHLCTVLYNHGVSLVYIQKYMGHLSEYMLGYYVRPKDTYQENTEYTEKVIREIAEDNTKPLGGNMLGEKIKENIKKFIQDNNFNVHTDVESIVKALGDKVVVRGKTGGVCIKTSLIPCSQDARTNEMMCAYDLCPNLFHFYYMADVSYMNFQTLQDSYKALIQTGHIKAAQKELAKMRDVINRRLIPELEELDKELNIKGYSAIIDKYPSLIDIIENREQIKNEIELWRKKR